MIQVDEVIERETRPLLLQSKSNVKSESKAGPNRANKLGQTKQRLTRMTEVAIAVVQGMPAL